MSAGGGKDSLEHRKNDTITINFRYLDSSRLQKIDSSIFDFGRRFPRPATWVNLGNTGAPARDLIWSPIMASGWDPGWHSYDIYRFKPEDTKFYNTTKPYTELGYLLASRAEQFISVMHTQNVRPNWNFSLEYRLISAPGTFQNSVTNHSGYRVGSWYQSKNKRYQNFFVFTGNKLAAAENGGIQQASDLDSLAYSNQLTIPVRLGNNILPPGGNPFNVVITTGSRYTTYNLLLRQQYDLGQKDSIVTDTSVIPLFYPRVRLEHTISYNTYSYRYFDFANFGYTLDTTYYKNYGLAVNPIDSFYRGDRWTVVTNDFSIYQFPDSKNPQQFFKLGASLELLKGSFDTANLQGIPGTLHRVNTQNAFGHAEYRNKTRNQKWDIEAFGKLYLNGLDAGDYNAYISLRRLISRQVGYFQAGFENANRTPSYVFGNGSSFNYDTANHHSFGKENTTHIFASLDQPQHQLSLTASYFLMTNYAYFSDYYKENQSSTLFNVLQIGVRKQFTLYRHWKWRTNTTFQQVAGTASVVHVPLLVSVNQVGYDGSFGFRNLNISFGTEIRYVSGYKADGYAPVSAQFYTQSDTTVRQPRPDVSLYLHLRVRSFVGFVRAEGVNSLAFSPHGFGWYRNNFVAPNYPSQGMVLRFGFFWGFIN